MTFTPEDAVEEFDLQLTKKLDYNYQCGYGI